MMLRLASLFARLRDDRAGSVVVETAIVIPVLVVLALGTFDVSRMIARQSEMQAGSTDVQGIVLAVANGTSTNVGTIKQVLMSSLSLSTDEVTVTKVYRCNSNTSLVTAASSCSSNAIVSTYVQVTLTESYEPVWTNFGVGQAINYRIQRTVQVS